MNAHTIRLAALAGLFAVSAAPVAAQPVDVRVRVDTQAIREVAEELRIVLRDVFGPELQQELRHELSSASRDIADIVEHLARTPWVGDGNWSWSSMSQRNFPAAQTDRETRTFAIGTSGEFTLDNVSGDLRITAGSGRDLTIEVIRHARGRTESDARAGLARVRAETTHRGDRVTARTVYPNERQSDFSVSVDYVVTAPAGTRITAKTISGDIAVTRIAGELTVSTTSGDVTVTHADRLLSAKTISGDIELRDVKAEGLLEAASISGDVTATNVTARRLDVGSMSGTATVRNAQTSATSAKSLSGDVVFDGTLASGGRYEFQSQSGSVRLSLDGRTGFNLEARTFSGSVRSDLPLQTAGVSSSGRRANRALSGTFGDGSATVSATSFSGSVVITKR